MCWAFKWSLTERSSLHLVFGLSHGRPLQMKKGSLTESTLTNIFQEVHKANKEIWVLLEKCFSITVLPILAGAQRQTLPSGINPSILAVLSNATVKRSIIFADYAIFQWFVPHCNFFPYWCCTKHWNISLNDQLCVPHLTNEEINDKTVKFK